LSGLLIYVLSYLFWWKRLLRFWLPR